MEKGVRPNLPSQVDSGPRPEERPPAKRKAAGSSPATGIRLISPACSANYSRGLASGKPKAEFTRLIVILDLSPEESKVQSVEMVKAGRGRNSVQRFKCQQCGKRFQEPREKPFGTDVRLPQETVCRILHCLVEGNNVRGTARLCDVEKRTVINMLKLAGESCERLLVEKIHNVKVQDCLELDEVWTYVGCHQKRLTPERVGRGMVGDAYTFICLERSTKWSWLGTWGSAIASIRKTSFQRSGGRQHQADSMLVLMASSRTKWRLMLACTTARTTRR